MWCPGDCIPKHTLFLEAYIDEAYQLDNEREYWSLLDQLREQVVYLQDNVRHCPPSYCLAQIRKIRKQLMKHVWAP